MTVYEDSVQYSVQMYPCGKNPNNNHNEHDSFNSLAGFTPQILSGITTGLGTGIGHGHHGTPVLSPGPTTAQPEKETETAAALSPSPAQIRNGGGESARADTTPVTSPVREVSREGGASGHTDRQHLAIPTPSPVRAPTSAGPNTVV